MNSYLAIHVVLTIVLTFALLYWMYPVNDGAVGIIFLLANGAVAIGMAATKSLLSVVKH